MAKYQYYNTINGNIKDLKIKLKTEKGSYYDHSYLFGERGNMFILSPFEEGESQTFQQYDINGNLVKTVTIKDNTVKPQSYDLPLIWNVIDDDNVYLSRKIIDKQNNLMFVELIRANFQTGEVTYSKSDLIKNDFEPVCNYKELTKNDLKSYKNLDLIKDSVGNTYVFLEQFYYHDKGMTKDCFIENILVCKFDNTGKYVQSNIIAKKYFTASANSSAGWSILSSDVSIKDNKIHFLMPSQNIGKLFYLNFDMDKQTYSECFTLLPDEDKYFLYTKNIWWDKNNLLFFYQPKKMTSIANYKVALIDMSDVIR